MPSLILCDGLAFLIPSNPFLADTPRWVLRYWRMTSERLKLSDLDAI